MHQEKGQIKYNKSLAHVKKICFCRVSTYTQIASSSRNILLELKFRVLRDTFGKLGFRQL